jgi:tyrosyl-tRNA synthetase
MHYQRLGHRPIALVGGATGLIGDPSGKSDERNLLSVETVQKNADAIRKVLERFLDFDAGHHAASLVNNYDWMNRFSYIEFLRDVGKMFRVGTMLSKDSVRSRMEGSDEGMSYTEFSYQVLQGYDFLHLFQEFGCRVQIGGADQWGNITAGIELVRKARGESLYGMTMPLLTKSDGGKFGKTESGAVWLTAPGGPDDPSTARTTSYDFHQFWLRTTDADVMKLLCFYTFLDDDALADLEGSVINSPESRTAQRTLADEVTSLVHGPEAVTLAEKAAAVMYGKEPIREVSDEVLAAAFNQVQSVTKSRAALDAGLPLLDAFVETGLAKSKGEARRAIAQGGTYVNNERIADADHQLTTKDLASPTTIVLRKGKKEYRLLRFN